MNDVGTTYAGVVCALDEVGGPCIYDDLRPPSTTTTTSTSLASGSSHIDSAASPNMIGAVGLRRGLNSGGLSSRSGSRDSRSMSGSGVGAGVGVGLDDKGDVYRELRASLSTSSRRFPQWDIDSVDLTLLASESNPFSTTLTSFYSQLLEDEQSPERKRVKRRKKKDKKGKGKRGGDGERSQSGEARAGASPGGLGFFGSFRRALGGGPATGAPAAAAAGGGGGGSPGSSATTSDGETSDTKGDGARPRGRGGSGGGGRERSKHNKAGDDGAGDGRGTGTVGDDSGGSRRSDKQSGKREGTGAQVSLDDIAREIARLREREELARQNQLAAIAANSSYGSGRSRPAGLLLPLPPPSGLNSGAPAAGAGGVGSTSVAGATGAAGAAGAAVAVVEGEGPLHRPVTLATPPTGRKAGSGGKGESAWEDPSKPRTSSPLALAGSPTAAGASGDGSSGSSGGVSGRANGGGGGGGGSPLEPSTRVLLPSDADIAAAFPEYTGATSDDDDSDSSSTFDGSPRRSTDDIGANGNSEANGGDGSGVGSDGCGGGSGGGSGGGGGTDSAGGSTSQGDRGSGGREGEAALRRVASLREKGKSKRTSSINLDPTALDSPNYSPLASAGGRLKARATLPLGNPHTFDQPPLWLADYMAKPPRRIQRRMDERMSLDVARTTVYSIMEPERERRQAHQQLMANLPPATTRVLSLGLDAFLDPADAI